MIKRLLVYLLPSKFSENNSNLLKLNYGIIALLYIFSASMLMFLPSDMPMQWGSDGNVNYTLPSVIGVWLVPTIILLVTLSLKKQNRLNLIHTGVFIFASILYVFTYIKILST